MQYITDANAWGVQKQFSTTEFIDWCPTSYPLNTDSLGLWKRVFFRPDWIVSCQFIQRSKSFAEWESKGFDLTKKKCNTYGALGGSNSKGSALRNFLKVVCGVTFALLRGFGEITGSWNANRGSERRWCEVSSSSSPAESAATTGYNQREHILYHFQIDKPFIQMYFADCLTPKRLSFDFGELFWSQIQVGFFFFVFGFFCHVLNDKSSFPNKVPPLASLPGRLFDALNLQRPHADPGSVTLCSVSFFFCSV